MFDPQFYLAALPEMVLHACAQRLDCTPVVQLQIADGSVFELCDVLQITPGWLGVAYHRDGTCTGADFIFVPHSIVTRVDVSLQQAAARRLGFRHAQTTRN